MSDTDHTESPETRITRLETQRNAAVGVGALIFGALALGAWNLATLATRLDERVDRLTRDVAESSTAAAHAKETGDRLGERLAAMGDRVERIDRAVTLQLPAIQQGIESLRVELASTRSSPSRAR
jgi:outer membrane murein-binding lipoprotein Lpp